MPSLSSLLVTGVASAVGALFAAFIGLHFGMARVRQERAFEARSKWFEEVTQFLFTQSILYEAQADIEAGLRRAGVRPDDFYSDLDDHGLLFDSLLRQANLYASKEAVRALNLLNGVLAGMKEARAGFLVGDEQDVGPVDMFRCVAAFTSAMGKRLAIEYRAYIGLEPLDGPTYKKFDRSTRELGRNGSAVSLKELVASWRAMHWIEPELRTEQNSNEGIGNIVLEWSDDSGGTWQQLYEGPPISLRVREISEEGKPEWTVLYAERELIPFTDALERLTTIPTEPTAEPPIT